MTSTVTVRPIPTHVGATEALALVRRRHRRLLGLLPSPHECVMDGRTLYWPLDLATAVANVKPAFRPEREARVALARDRITGKLGTVDVKLGDLDEEDVKGDVGVLKPRQSDDEEWWEFARNQMVIRYRPTWVRDLELVERRRVHVPYSLVHCGPDSWLVDLMLGRVVHIEVLDQANRAVIA